MRVKSIFFAVCTAIAVFAAPALAADDAHPVRQACAADFAKYCAGQDPWRETGRACMREHRAEFSEPCRTAMDARRKEMMARIRTACGADIAKFCNTGSQTDEGPRRCLRDHKDELSDSCKAAFPNHRS